MIFVEFKWIRTNEGIINKLYNKDKNTKNHNQSLVLSLFNQDYSLACVVLATSKFQSFPVAQFLKDFKGPTDPIHHKNTHLRKIFGTENKVINYIHTSDTNDALNELKLFFPDFVKKTTKSSCMPPLKYEYRESVSVYYTIYNIKFSIYQKFRRTKVVGLENLFIHEKTLSIIQNKDSGIMNDLEKIFKSQLDMTTMCGIFEEKIQCLFELLIKIEYTSQHVEKILKMCEGLGVVDKWDKLILKCQAIQGNPKRFL